MPRKSKDPIPEAPRVWRKRRQPVEREMGHMCRVLAQHASWAFERTGRMEPCGCDVCRYAARRSVAIRDRKIA